MTTLLDASSIVLRFFFRLLSCISLTILHFCHFPSCSYIVAAARLVNIITLRFYFHDSFTSNRECQYIYYRCSLSLLFFTISWPFLCQGVKLLGNTGEFGRSCFSPLVSLRICQILMTVSTYYSTNNASMWLNNYWIRCILALLKEVKESLTK